ncbi:hypothetical protein OROGR_029451 [Orobanche gracilis]
MKSIIGTAVDKSVEITPDILREVYLPTSFLCESLEF